MISLKLRVDDIGPDFLQEAQRAAILRALRECEGAPEEAAVLLGIGRSTMYRQIANHEITDGERYS